MKAIIVWWLFSGQFAMQAYPQDQGALCTMNAMQLNAMTSAAPYRCELGLLWVPA